MVHLELLELIKVEVAEKNAIYRPVMRIDLSLSDDGEEFYKYENKGWQKWTEEGIDFQFKARSYYENRFDIRLFPKISVII